MYTTRKLPNTRIDVADALRGIAVAGIILYHSVEHFNIFTQETIIHALPSDQMVADILAWLLSGKMYGIFAMLFGLSFFIMNDNQQQKGKNFSLRFAWRMCLLFMFGIINVAFYDGDILMLYACYGLLLIPISYLPSKWVWCIIVLLAIQPVEIYCLLTGTTIDHSAMWELYDKICSTHAHGTFWENAVGNLRYGFELNLRFNVFSGRLTQLLCLFILGMQLGRQRLFYNEGRHLKIWHNILIRSAIVVMAAGIMAQAHLQSLYPAHDCLGGSLCLVCFRRCSQGTAPPLHLWSYESYQLSATVHHRLFHLLRLWFGLLSSFRYHLRRDGWCCYGHRAVLLCPLLV